MTFSKTKSYGQAYVDGWPVDYQIEIFDCTHRTEALKGVIKSIEQEISRIIENDAAARGEVLPYAGYEPARKEMLEALPSIIKLLNNPTFVETIDKAGYQFDVAAFFKVFALATGWEFTNDIIVSTKPEQDRVSKLETRVKFLEDRLGYR